MLSVSLAPEQPASKPASKPVRTKIGMILRISRAPFGESGCLQLRRTRSAEHRGQYDNQRLGTCGWPQSMATGAMRESACGGRCQSSAAGEPSPARLADTGDRVRRCFGFSGTRPRRSNDLRRHLVGGCGSRGPGRRTRPDPRGDLVWSAPAGPSVRSRRCSASSGWPRLGRLGRVRHWLAARHGRRAVPAALARPSRPRVPQRDESRARGALASRRSTARPPWSAPAEPCFGIRSRLNCWSNCTDNVFFVDADPGLRCRWTPSGWASPSSRGSRPGRVRRLAAPSATRAGRAALWTVLVPAALAGDRGGAYAIALIRDPAEDPKAASPRVFLARAISFAVPGRGRRWTSCATPRTPAAISRLAADLGAAPNPGRSRLRSPGRSGTSGSRWRTRSAARGATSMPTATRRATGGGARTATPIVRNGEPVAIVIHDRRSRREGARTRDRRRRAARGRQRAAASRGARPARGPAGLPCAHRRGGRRGPPAHRARPPRRRAAAAARALLRAPSRPCRRRRRRRRPRGRSRRRAMRCRPRSRSCASSRTASTRRSSPRQGSARRSGRSPTRRRPVELGECRRALPGGRRAAAYLVVGGRDRRGRARARTTSRLSLVGRAMRSRSRSTGAAIGATCSSRTASARSAAGSRSSDRMLRAEIPCA